MLSLPVPIFVAICLIFVLARHLRSENVNLWLTCLLLTASIQSAVVGLRFGYGWEMLARFMPLIFPLVPILAWLVFLSFNFREISWNRDWPNVLPIIFVALVWLVAPDVIDFVLISISAAYGILVLRKLAASGGQFPRAKLEAGMLPFWFWRLLAIVLLASAILDLVIALIFIFGEAAFVPIIISTFSSLSLLMLGALSLMDIQGANDPETEEISEQTKLADQEIIDKLSATLRKDDLYLEPELSRARLAKRLHIPIQQLSTTVNRHTGKNISRFVNEMRIEHANDLLRAGRPVTSVVFESGFSTKSNFHREFSRYNNLAPTEWLKQQSTQKS